MKKILHHARRSAIALIGSLVVLLGIILVPLPGPGLLVVIIGLAILATEFAWAENWLQKSKGYIKQKTQHSKDVTRAETVDKRHQ